MAITGVSSIANEKISPNADNRREIRDHPCEDRRPTVERSTADCEIEERSVLPLRLKVDREIDERSALPLRLSMTCQRLLRVAASTATGTATGTDLPRLSAIGLGRPCFSSSCKAGIPNPVASAPPASDGRTDATPWERRVEAQRGKQSAVLEMSPHTVVFGGALLG